MIIGNYDKCEFLVTEIAIRYEQSAISFHNVY